MLDASQVMRPATKADAADMARLINIAGEGMPYVFWRDMAESGVDPWEVGRTRAMRDEGSFSWTNATVTESGGRIAALLLSYPVPEAAEPVDTTGMPPVFVPLQELENLVPGSFYVNVLATYADFRGRGLGARLLAHADTLAGGQDMSIIVSDGNRGAMRLYERHGYHAIAERPLVSPEGWSCPGSRWVLMVKRSLAGRTGQRLA
ncbi:putative acetyltransferase [Hartmannibacter diazotrophicus]|uniref:Putative acetyltransferase n=1 Tax=Hartmannibacter diazotrophicus TaxID=1482074 RepID=A0A2C9D0B1_9HYPH|nr:GNAT family N-acetyltransferase [Hartmannibacter diazotrophicus]SON53686.1 putative acetyltransferase [Hartmannibacter diazotrophicus]